MTKLLNLKETIEKVSLKSGLSFPACEKVIAATIDVLHDEMERRGKKDPTLYGSIQDGTYKFMLGEYLEPSTFLPGDWWSEICRRSQTNYPDAEKVIVSFRDLWVASKEFFEPFGTIEETAIPADNIFYRTALRRDFIGPNLEQTD